MWNEEFNLGIYSLSEEEEEFFEALPIQDVSEWKAWASYIKKQGIDCFKDLPKDDQFKVLRYIIDSNDISGLVYCNAEKVHWQYLFGDPHYAKTTLESIRIVVVEAAEAFVVNILKATDNRMRKMH